MLTVSDLHQLLGRAPLHAQTVRLTQPPGGLTPARISPTPPTSRPVVTGPRSGSVGNHDAVLRRSGLRCTRRTGLPAAAGRGRVRTVPGVHQRYLKSSKIVTTNRSISECGQVLGD